MPDWTGQARAGIKGASSASVRVHNAQESQGQRPKTPRCLGRVAAYRLAEAGHDLVKCVRPELIERGG